MSPTMSLDTVSARRIALVDLDRMVRAELERAARRWAMAAEASIELTAYDQHYGWSPDIGGHWTLLTAWTDTDRHEVAMLTVGVEFDANRPVRFRVSGVTEAVADGCTPSALRAALEQCAGPLRQVTPLDLGLLAEAAPPAR